MLVAAPGTVAKLPAGPSPALLSRPGRRTESAVKILGIPCELTEPTWRKAIRTVLTRIRDRRPNDCETLKLKVLRFEPLPERAKRSVGARWTVLARDKLGRGKRSHARRVWNWETHQGTVQLRVPAPSDMRVAVATVAHELGHAATRQQEVTRRYRKYSHQPGWALEAVADMHAYKWGCAREIRYDHRFVRDVRHHGFLPGILAEDTIGDLISELRMTRNFYLVITVRPVKHVGGWQITGQLEGWALGDLDPTGRMEVYYSTLGESIGGGYQALVELADGGFAPKGTKLKVVGTMPGAEGGPARYAVVPIADR